MADSLLCSFEDAHAPLQQTYDIRGRGFLTQRQIFVNETADPFRMMRERVLASKSAVEMSGLEIAFGASDCLDLFSFRATLRLLF